MPRFTATTALTLGLLFTSTIFGQITTIGKAQSYKLPQKVKMVLAISALDKDADDAWDETQDIAEDIVKEYYLETYVKTVALRATVMQNEYDKVKGLNAYRATKEVVLVIDSVAIFEKVMEDLIKEGATQITSVELISNNQEATLQNLKGLAIEDARAQAEALAKSGNVKLGHAISIECLPSEPQKIYTLKVDPLVSFEGINLNKSLMEVKVKVSFAINH